MKINLKIYKGTQIYVFKEEGKVVGWLGIKLPLTAQNIIDSLKK